MSPGIMNARNATRMIPTRQNRRPTSAPNPPKSLFSFDFSGARRRNGTTDTRIFNPQSIAFKPTPVVTQNATPGAPSVSTPAERQA